MIKFIFTTLCGSFFRTIGKVGAYICIILLLYLLIRFLNIPLF